MYSLKIIMRNTLKTKHFTGDCGICIREVVSTSIQKQIQSIKLCLVVQLCF